MLPDCFSSSWVWWWETTLLFEQIYTAQQAHICGALTGVEETRGEKVCVWEGEGEREREKPEFWKPSQCQITREIKAFYLYHFNNNSTVSMRERERDLHYHYQLVFRSAKYGQILRIYNQIIKAGWADVCMWGKHTTNVNRREPQFIPVNLHLIAEVDSGPPNNASTYACRASHSKIDGHHSLASPAASTLLVSGFPRHFGTWLQSFAPIQPQEH